MASENLLYESYGLVLWVICTIFMVPFSYFRAWQHSSPFTFIKWKNLQEYSSEIILLCSTEERKSNCFEKSVTNDRSFINGRTIPLYILSATFFNLRMFFLTIIHLLNVIYIKSTCLINHYIAWLEQAVNARTRLYLKQTSWRTVT